MITEIESEWYETSIPCPVCSNMTYSDGENRPQCSACYRPLTDEEIWTWLIEMREAEE